jgi:hypothetical protein
MHLMHAAFLGLGFCTSALAAGDDKNGEVAPKKAKAKFTFAKETTWVAGPLDKDGYPNYPAALNERLGKGVTPENNANVLIWKAIGPRPDGKPMQPEFFKLMGMEEQPEKGDYFIEFAKFANERLKISPDEKADSDEQYFQASRRTWKDKDLPHVAAWLKANEKPLDTVVAATKRSHYFSPMLPPKSEKRSSSLLETLLTGVTRCRGVAQGLVCRAMLNVGEGHYDAAWQDLLACHRLAKHVASGACLIEALVGLAIDMMASKGDLVFVEQAKVDSKRIQKCLADLQALPPMPAIDSMVDNCDRFTMLENVTLVSRHGISYFPGVAGAALKYSDEFTDLMLEDTNWDPALKVVNGWYDRLVKALREEDRGVRMKTLEKFVDDVLKLKRSLDDAQELNKAIQEGKSRPESRGRIVGQILITLLLPAVHRIQEAVDRAVQVRQNGFIAFALGAYQRDQGSYPKTLNELAPKYLAKIPNDYFTGAPLAYRPSEKGYLLYSFGPNGKDDGGRWLDDFPRGDDPSVRIPIPTPKSKP